MYTANEVGIAETGVLICKDDGVYNLNGNIYGSGKRDFNRIIVTRC